MMDVTTSTHADERAQARADRIARTWGLRRVPRGAVDDGIPTLVVTRDGLVLRLHGRDRRWHPGMLHALVAAGERHPLIALTGLRRGERVLDTTLGLGTDATFLARWTGTRVAGVEVVPALALMAREGLARTGADVEVIVGHSLDVLRGAPDRSWHLVVADPMFPARDGPVGPSLEHVRWAGDARPPERRWLAEARRVAARAVVVRDATGGALLERLGAPVVHGRRDRAARYGVWPARPAVRG